MLKWQALEALLRRQCEEFGFGEIRTPIFEDTELFARGVGAATDIVQKEMYTFTDLGGRSLTLRPENTAGTCRAYIENKLYGKSQPQKLYYIGPMFRHEKPQAGRFRQFHQFGIEIIGTTSALADAEIIVFTWELYRRLGIEGLSLHINSVGCPVCRPKYKALLQNYFRPQLEDLCASCKDRFERNPLRILDCKSEICQKIGQNAPRIEEHLCSECAEHFEHVQAALIATDVPFTIDPHLVRGLDYYTKTAFEIIKQDIGAQSAVCGGGRYDGLIEELGGDPCPGVGVAIGMERIFAALKAQGNAIKVETGIDVAVIALPGNQEAALTAFALTSDLRRLGLKTSLDLLGKSLKAQIKQADKDAAAYAVIIGEDEIASGNPVLRNMATGEQQNMSMDEIKSLVLSP
jgi:histidyl-tRNA synthetase